MKAGPAWAGLSRGRARRLERGARARRGAWLSQRPGLGRRADRHDRPRHGLRHDRHRARFRAGQVQEARGRRLFQDHQPRRARRACARSAMTRSGSRTSSPTPSAARRSPTRRAINHAALRAKGMPEAAIDKVEAALARRLRHPLRLQQVDARGRDAEQRAQDLRPSATTRRASTSSTALGFSKAEIEAANIFACGAMTLGGRALI